MQLVLVSLAAIGHAFLWIGLLNRLHAVGLPRRTIGIITLAGVLVAAIVPLLIGWWVVQNHGLEPLLNSGDVILHRMVGGYVILCCFIVPVTLLRTIYFRTFRQLPPVVRFHRRRPAAIDLARAAISPEENRHHMLAHLPLNEILRLTVAEWVLEVPQLAPALDGLSIVQLSDLHFTGRIGKAYFREVVRVCNELRPDLTLVTGDLVDRPACMEWIADTLGQLAARAGVYFILGNHDLQVDSIRLRRTLEQHGLADLGGRFRQIEINGASIILAGSERPWIDGAVDVDGSPPPDSAGPLRIMLSHTPDQLAWARVNHADLLLTGHTHGGQVCFPPIGAIFTPTAEGVKYISGVFFASPTILHVTRGVSGDIPIRWNCPPEIAHLKLRAARTYPSRFA